MSEPLHTLGVAELGRLLDGGGASSVEITTHLLARVAGHQHLGAFLCVDDEVALRLRDDMVTETDNRAANQKSAPAVEDGLYLVPKVIGS